MHCLRDCRFAREIWNSFIAFAWHDFLLMNVRDWIKAQARGPQAHSFMAALCGIWRWRNDVLLGDNSWTAMNTVNGIRTEKNDYSLCQASRRQRVNCVERSRWATPSVGSFKLNTDGS